MAISKVLITVFVVSAMAMSFENVEGRREMAMKEATAKAYPQVLNEKYEVYKPKEDYEGYKPKEDYEGYKPKEDYEGYKPKEDYEGYKPKEDYECEGYKDKDCYEYGNCEKSPYNEDGDRQYMSSAYKKLVAKPKEMAEKHEGHHNFP